MREGGGGKGICCGLSEVKAVAKKKGREDGFGLGRRAGVIEAEGNLEALPQILAQLGQCVRLAGELRLAGALMAPDSPVNLLPYESSCEGIGLGIGETANREDFAGKADALAGEREGAGVVPCPLAEAREDMGRAFRVDILEDDAQTLIWQVLDILDLPAKTFVLLVNPGWG